MSEPRFHRMWRNLKRNGNSWDETVMEQAREAGAERKPTVLKGGLKTYRVALYEVRDGKAELLDLLELDARDTKNIFRTLHRRLERQGREEHKNASS